MCKEKIARKIIVNECITGRGVIKTNIEVDKSLIYEVMIVVTYFRNDDKGDGIPEFIYDEKLFISAEKGFDFKKAHVLDHHNRIGTTIQLGVSIIPVNDKIEFNPIITLGYDAIDPFYVTTIVKNDTIEGSGVIKAQINIDKTLECEIMMFITYRKENMKFHGDIDYLFMRKSILIDNDLGLSFHLKHVIKPKYRENHVIEIGLAVSPVNYAIEISANLILDYIHIITCSDMIAEEKKRKEKKRYSEKSKEKVKKTE